MKAYHLYGKAPYFTNCFVLTDNNGCAVLIDCSAEISKIEKILENDRCTVSAILLTHGHADHRETLDECVSAFKCPVYLGADDAKLFNIENTNDLPDMDTLTFGEMKFFCFHTPGHTPGGYCIICEDMLFSGDTLFSGTVGRCDLEGGDFKTLEESLKKILETVKGDLKLLPGHNNFSTFELEKEQNPYLKSVM